MLSKWRLFVSEGQKMTPLMTVERILTRLERS
ncbi:hypothetical protein ABMB67_001469 [Halalkalibacter oceani]